ncbi:MAG: acetyl-CoA carboxylase biotin carboxyl carrier protein [Candidatus Atribacteria bacterium]|jgi:acetyl-CoA carboxylase biotin carboxyl carrier protein|nr:MAG: acetyl-CoA carboxylase biotin carboxyl carrier protein [Candidatus Atribacteria bacterium]
MQELKDIIQLLKDEDLTEITVADGDQRVTVRRILEGKAFYQTAAAQEAPQTSNAMVTATTTARELPEREFALTAPLVGTFYRRPSPQDEPFVVVGDIVQAGDTICIIEAMKVMNEIKAEEPGRVRQALLEDGAVVEFGQSLFIFERL